MDSTVVVFDIDKCHFELNCPYFIQNMTIDKLKKIFTMMCTQSYRNTEAIAITEHYIDLCIEEAHEEWRKTSAVFCDRYVDTKFHYEMTSKQKLVIERENKKLYNAAKSKKRAYDRMVKLKNLFVEIKNKYSI